MSKDICVVGNAGSILQQQKGSEIDSYTDVIRFNNFQLRGFEKHVGTKTTIWATSFYKDIKDPLCDIDTVLCPLPRELMGNNSDARYKFNVDLVDKYRMRTQHIPLDMFNELLEHIPVPSTGIALLYWWSQLRGKIDPNDVYGFSFFEGTHHYFDEVDHCSHKGHKEKQFAIDHIFTSVP